MSDYWNYRRPRQTYSTAAGVLSRADRRQTVDTEKARGVASRPIVVTRRVSRDGRRLLGRRANPAPGGEWDVTVGFEPYGDELRPVSVKIQPGVFDVAPAPGVITTGLLRAIPIGALVDAFRKEYVDDLAAEKVFFGGSGVSPYTLPPRTNRSGPRYFGEEFYQEVAWRYVQALKADPRRPIEWMKQYYPGYTKANIRDWVYRAREKGYLTSTGRGRAEGWPTDKLRRAAGSRPLDPSKPAKLPRRSRARPAVKSRVVAAKREG
jgi:hypothetical protein